MTALRFALLLLLTLAIGGCLPYTSVSVVIDSADVKIDVEKTASVLRALGYLNAEVSDYAPKGSIGFRGYPGQFTVVTPDQEKHRVVVSFSERASEFSPRAKTAYTAMLSALHIQFGHDRVVGPNELSATIGSNPAFTSDPSQQAAPIRLVLR